MAWAFYNAGVDYRRALARERVIKLRDEFLEAAKQVHDEGREKSLRPYWN